jgi:hypothetical protein
MAERREIDENSLREFSERVLLEGPQNFAGKG